MPRLPEITPESLSGESGVYQRLEESRGSPPGLIWRVLLNAPEVTDAVLTIADTLRKRVELDPIHRELAVLMVGQVTNCGYEFGHHWNSARKLGIATDKLEDLADFKRSPHFSDFERCILRAARDLTLSNRIDDGDFATLQTELTNRQITELVATIAWYNAVIRMLFGLNIQLEPDFVRHP